MNQILVTEKIYVTPELKRKKKTYKMLFMLSIFSIIFLFSSYIYAEYDRNKEESVSDDILSFLNQEEDNTTISSYENALVVNITNNITAELYDILTEDNLQILQTATATSIYTAADGKQYETIGIVKVPRFNLTYPILSKTTDALMKVSACKFHGPNPNEVGNLCIIAHNYRRKGVFFSDIHNLEIGDIVEIQDLSQKIVQYEVYDVHTVMPDNVSDTTQRTNGRKEVTLITCANYGKQRCIVRCKEKV